MVELIWSNALNLMGCHGGQIKPAFKGAPKFCWDLKVGIKCLKKLSWYYQDTHQKVGLEMRKKIFF